jgi:hypothetical protein
MSAFPDWKKFAVHQRRDRTGCIPTGYEILLRAADAKGIDFASFQDEFDLDQHGGQPKNNFVSVGDAVKKKYPNVEFTRDSFPKGKGSEKLAKVEELIRNKKPTLVSLAISPDGGWHIMPVVDSDADTLILLRHVDKAGTPHTLSVKKSDFVMRHDKWQGGEDVAYLAKC